ncbi:hypothetical protein BE18_10510 [Sorangium cellulosum]|uniref:Restriction endonuclease type IV Mrr domain-containing protein n=1 Tax=Sorangium cellulosum TaxID=56 RepID=A0A150RHD9_SORCE|nr:hypothetical protein BE18_10510 [Sorangium cellulosum]
MAYFAGYDEALDPTGIAAPEGSKPLDSGGDCLPFDHLDDRRFETLAYRLKCVEHGNQARVFLMQGVGERGRDVVVYTQEGHVLQIVQCKRLRDKLTAPQLIRELVKLALHAFSQPEILGNGPVAYEIWCPSGLSEPAMDVVARWPKLWTEREIVEEATGVLRKYAAFSAVTWDAAKEFVLNQFPRIVAVHERNGIDISAQARRDTSIHQAFFQATPVVSLSDLAKAGIVLLKDEDVKHIVDRISSFAPDKRLAFMSGTVMGVSAEMVSKLNQSEYRALVNAVIQGTFGIIFTMQNACARLAKEMAEEFRTTTQPRNDNLPSLLLQVLNISALSKINNLMYKRLNFQPGFEAYTELTLEQRFETHVTKLWDEHQADIAGYDPMKHAVGSGEELRHRLGRHLRGRFTDRQAFEDDIRACLRQHIREIDNVFRKFMSLVPDDLLVISDTVTIFDDKGLAQKSVEDTHLLTKLRGSHIIPE